MLKNTLKSRRPKRALAGLLVFALVLAAGPAWGAGGVGDLKLVARAPKADPFRPLALSNKNFTPLAKKFGAINEDAVMTRIAGESLALAAGIDSAKSDAEKLDLIRLDFSGAGQFDRKPSFPLTKIATGVRKASAASIYTFGPGTTQVPHNGRNIPVFVEGMCMQHDGEIKELHVSMGVVAEGSCRFGKKVYGVRVIDADGRFGVNNAPAGTDAEEGASGGHGMQEKNPDAVDVVMIDTNSETFKRGVVPATLGQIAHLDGKWYRVSVSEDGSKISAEKIAAETGSVVVSHDNWAATLIAEKYTLSLRGGRKPVPVPAGRYVIRRYREHVLLSGAPRAAVLTVAAKPGSGKSGLSFSAGAGRVTRLKIGSPVVVKAKADTMGGGYAFGFSLTDVSGMKASVSLPGRPSPPVVKVAAKDKQVYSGKMEYG